MSLGEQTITSPRGTLVRALEEGAWKSLFLKSLCFTVGFAWLRTISGGQAWVSLNHC